MKAGNVDHHCQARF